MFSFIQHADRETPDGIVGAQALTAQTQLRIAVAQQDEFDAVADLFEAVRGYNATLDDRLALADDWRIILHDQFISTFAEPTEALWLLVWNGTQPVGLLVVVAHLDSPLLKHRRWAEVAALYVAPKCRGTGLAQQLMAEAHAWAGMYGFDRVQVHAAVANEGAGHFYRRSGFYPAQEVLRLHIQQGGTPPPPFDMRGETETHIANVA